MSSNPKNVNLNLILVGKTGHGKSATGNTLLLRDEFKSMNMSSSVTSRIQIGAATIEGRELKVVDLPGVIDTVLTEEDTVKLVLGSFAEAMRPSHGGYDAILFVMRYDVQFTAEEQKAVNDMKNMLGESFIKTHGILVMTHGDLFEVNGERKTIEQALRHWVCEQTGKFTDLVHEFEGRVVLINNKETDFEKNRSQINRLLSTVDSLNNGRYTHEDYKKAEPSRKKLLIKSRKANISQETHTKLSDLEKKINTAAAKKTLEKQLEILQNVRGRVEALTEDLEKQDEGTGVLNDVKDKAKMKLGLVNSEINFVLKKKNKGCVIQ